MKQIYSKLLFLVLFIFSIGTISAQTCSSTFTVSTSSTPSTCQANGTVTVTLNGDLTNLYNIQYGLTSSSGFTINPQEHNVMTNIPAGTYTVSVRAFCQIDAGYNVVKTVSNVIVGGNYIVPSVSFNATTSRKSYDVCNTGIVALNVTNGSGTFTFNITSAPAGAPTGLVTPTKVGTVYIFPGETYPSGNYVVQVQDGCYTSVATFTLGQISGFPPFTYTTSSGFRPTLQDNNCSNVYWYAGSVSTSNPDYYRYFVDGMYEVGAAPAASTPTVWSAWTQANLVSSSNLLLSIAPNNVSDFLAANSIRIFTRLKGCPTSATSFTTNIKGASMTNSVTSRDCSDYTYTIRPWTDYDGMLCYPLSVTVTRVSDNAVIFTNPSWSYNTAGLSTTLDYGTSYRITMSGQNGTVATTQTITNNRNLSFSTNRINCDNYQLYYAVPSYTTCWPVMVRIIDSGGTVVCTDSVTNTSYRYSCPLSYGQLYTFEATYPNALPTPYTQTYNTNVASTLPTAYGMSVYSSYTCTEDYGQLYISRSAGGSYYPVGTTFSVTGPAGYTPQTYTTTSSSSSFYLGTTTLPAGNYTLTVDHGCGAPIVTNVTLNGVYSGKTLAYTTQNTCSGMQVTPTGTMTYQGNPTTTYYRLTNGPAGFDKTVIGPGGSFTFSTPGTYTLGILLTNSATGCVINSKTIVYTADPLALSQTGTSAYECVDNVTGIILLQAINGVAPYTYQLWDKTNTIRLVPTDIVSSGQVHFEYGQADSTYTARIYDQCGNSFSQQITLAKLSTARIVYATENNVCNGDTIRLQCITLGNTAYNWTGPNGFTSTTQNPKIGNAQVNMTGWYHVSVQPEFCGEPVQDSTYIQVYAPLAAGAVTGVQTVCVRTTPTALSAITTGGSGVYTYQWQSSVDGTTAWTNIVGATSVTYIPPVKIQSIINYYRVIATDKCGIVNSNVITVTSKSCFILVNPNLRSRAGG